MFLGACLSIISLGNLNIPFYNEKQATWLFRILFSFIAIQIYLRAVYNFIKKKSFELLLVSLLEFRDICRHFFR